jgi:hypothetical protein
MLCPVCKAANTGGPQCRRCRADLSLLFAVEDRRRRLLAEARQALQHGDWRGAVRRADASERLHASAEARQLRAVGYLLGRDFARAWDVYRRSPKE